MSRNEQLCMAIRNGQVIQFSYKGTNRILEPSVLGYAKDTGDLVLVGYQTGGFSESTQFPPWRRFEAKRIRNIEAINKEKEKSNRPEIPESLQVTNPICSNISDYPC